MKNKRIMSALLALVIILSASAGAFADDMGQQDVVVSTGEVLDSPVTYFADVTPDNPYAEDIAFLAEAGIVEGTGDGMFAPDRMLTNEEYTTLIKRIYGENVYRDHRSEDEELADWPLGVTDFIFKESTVKMDVFLKYLYLNEGIVPYPRESYVVVNSIEGFVKVPVVSDDANDEPSENAGFEPGEEVSENAGGENGSDKQEAGEPASQSGNMGEAENLDIGKNDGSGESASEPAEQPDSGSDVVELQPLMDERVADIPKTATDTDYTYMAKLLGFCGADVKPTDEIRRDEAAHILRLAMTDSYEAPVPDIVGYVKFTYEPEFIAEAAPTVKSLMTLPEKVLTAFHNGFWRMTLGDDDINRYQWMFSNTIAGLAIYDEYKISFNNSRYLYHEMAHYLSYCCIGNFNSPNMVTLFYTEKAAAEETVSKYSTTNPHEFFAECYEFWTRCNVNGWRWKLKDMEKTMPLTYEYMLTLVEDGWLVPAV